MKFDVFVPGFACGLSDETPCVFFLYLHLISRLGLKGVYLLLHWIVQIKLEVWLCGILQKFFCFVSHSIFDKKLEVFPV